MKKYTILFVDDEEQNLLTFRHAFSKHYHVLTAISGREALEILAQHPVHLIVSDQRMPAMTGIQFLARQKNITLLSDFSDPAQQVWGNANQISIVLRNLLSNAIKFTPDGGHVTLSVLPDTHFLEIAVSDTGIGIADEDRQKLFDPDALYSTVGTAREKGTGLGLKLCKEYVEKQGGTLSVQSWPGTGTAFRFTLPVPVPA